jgi:hypothetical protein
MNKAILDTTHAMQTAIAPVFLIMGAGTLLGSMAIRYGRVLDRARKVLADREVTPAQSPRVARLDAELALLYRRARLLRSTIILDAASIFCVVLTVLLLFGMILTDLAASYVPMGTFGASLIFLIVSVMLFIRDFAISLRALKTEIQAERG